MEIVYMGYSGQGIERDSMVKVELRLAASKQN